MDPIELASIGKTEVEVTRLGLGGAPMGGLFTDVAERQAKHINRDYVILIRHPFMGAVKAKNSSGRFFPKFLGMILCSLQR